MPETLYLIDVMSLIFQVFHAIPEMTGPRGQPTNAVFGFARDLAMILEQKRPTHLICALDSPGPSQRNEIYPQYKANRAEAPDDLLPQIPMVIDVIQGYRLPAVSFDGWEADDVIATLALRAAAECFDVRIVSGDKDIRQLLGPKVKLYNVRKDAEFGAEELAAEWGIRPDQVPDFQGLVGDSVDNIPGVPLIGPKKAQALLERFGTLEEVLAHADEAPGQKLRENLKKYAEQARISRQLATLRTDLPLTLDWEAARVVEPDRRRLLELFTGYGFRRLADAMRSLEVKPNQQRTWEIIDTPEKFASFLAALRPQKTFCVDLETTSLDAVRAEIVGWAFCWQAGQASYIPVDGPPRQRTLPAREVAAALKPILEDPAVEVCNQNIKYDLLVLRRAGITVPNVGVDPMVGDYLLEAGARSHGLDALAERYLNHRMIPITDLIGSGKQQKRMFEVDIERAAEYASEDADIAFQLAAKIGQKLRDEGLWDLYWNLERPLIPVLAEMEWNGIRVDVNELQRQAEEIGRKLQQLVREIHEMAGREFNIDSPKQLAVILFDELHLPVTRKTKTGASTNQDVLEKLAVLHPLPAKIIEHRGLAKLKGTYLDALPALVNPETGRIHTSFSQVTAATGRLSSSDPNLQNIPIRTPEGERVRKAFVAEAPDWNLVCADYSQVELRLLAHYSRDEALAAAFRHGADIHASVAAEIFGVSPDAVTPEMRRVAKAVNFGVIYGQSPFGLSEALRIGQEEAAAFIENYFAKYAGVDRFITEVLTECQRTGYARTILGRRRAITGIRNTTGRQRNLPERTAINTVIQGSAADLIKRAMIAIHERLRREHSPARMLLQIHDELVFEAPEAATSELVELVRHEMQHALQLSVPLVVDVSVGKNWLELTPV